MSCADAGCKGETELASVKDKSTLKPEGRNPKRLEILKEWYAALCSKHNNNRELIRKEIDTLTNAEILIKLANFRPGDKSIWTIKQAERWLGGNGRTVWGFKKTQGGQAKKMNVTHRMVRI